MFASRANAADGGRTQRVVMLHDGRELRYSEVIAAWQQDHAFRDPFIATLTAVPFDAFFWETPPVSVATIEQPFEFVVVDSPSLAGVEAEPRAFAEHFSRDSPGVVSFPNLRGDAVLVVPRPLAPRACYGHLAAFLRGAPEDQKHALWREVGAALAARLSSRPTWVSTAGLGVYGLHVRLDSRPKYYRHAPYKAA